MKRKVITIVLLSILITLTFCSTVGVAFADEVNIALLSYRSENISQEEIDFALSNLQFKLEKDLPRLIRVEEIYDFNEQPLYCLYEFEDYYMIVIRSTGSVLKRSEGNSAYFGKNDGIKYYGGYGEYYICRDEEYISILSEETAEQSKLIEMQSRMQVMRELDYNDYIEAISTPMPLGAENRKNIKKLGNGRKDIIESFFGSEDYLYNYFAQEINIDYQLSKISNDLKKIYIDEVLSSMSGMTSEKYGYAYVGKFHYGYDVLYPKNLYNTCSLVAMTMLLQFFYRTYYNMYLIDSDLLNIALTGVDVQRFPQHSFTEIIHRDLMNYVKVLNTDETHSGAATYVNIDAGFERYFDDYGLNGTSTHFTSYTNMKGAIDDGFPAIMTIGAGRGFDDRNIEQGLSGHNVVAYGYTTNSLGVIDEFVCHASWHREMGYDINNNPIAECAKLFVNKFYAAGNVYLSH